MAVIAFHVAAVEELVEGGGELICVAGGVVGGSRWPKAVFDVVPRVHGWLSCSFRLFPVCSRSCLCGVARVFRARFPARHDTIVPVRA